MAGLEGIVRNIRGRAFLFPIASMLGCSGNGQDSVPQDTSSYETGDTHTGDTDTDTDTDSGTNLTYDAPLITSSLTATGYVDQQFSYTLTATQDATGTGGSLNCTFNAPFDFQQTGCTITYTPTSLDLDMSPYNVDVQVSDNNGEDEGTLELTIAEDSGENHAPTISTTSLSSATTNTAYSSSITATDADGDRLTYSLTSGPSWLSINSSSGALSGTPSTSGTESVSVSVTDGSLSASQTYSLLVGGVATLDMDVIDGDTGGAVDDSCSVEVVVTNSSSGRSYSATSVSGVASIALDETGTYNVSVASTNSGSNCYGGFAQDEWLDVSSGSNTGWVTLIPETYATEVASVVGSQIDMGDISGHAAGDVDNVTKLLKYESGVSSRVPYTRGWNSSIKDGTVDLEVDTIDWDYNGIQYNDGLQLAVGYWNGNLAPSVIQIASGGDIGFTRTSNWQTAISYVGSTGVISDVEVDYTAVGSTGDVYDVGALFAHEIGHSMFEHTDVDVFIMNSSPSVDEPHELELLIARIYNNIGAESPTDGDIDLYNSYSE